MDNEATVGNQWVAPNNAFYAKNVPVPKRDIARAKALLKEAGVPNPTFTLVTPTTSDAQRLALVVQAMTREAGFNVKIQSTEFSTSLDMADKGNFEAYVLAWSGRADPDGNLYSFDACKQPLNYAGYCVPEVDELLNASRSQRDVGRAQEDLRADRVARPQGPAHRLSLPPQLAVGAQREAGRDAQHSGRVAAGHGIEDGRVSRWLRGDLRAATERAKARPGSGLRFACGGRPCAADFPAVLGLGARRITRSVRFAHCAQTPAGFSQMWMRAARAGLEACAPRRRRVAPPAARPRLCDPTELCEPLRRAHRCCPPSRGRRAGAATLRRRGAQASGPARAARHPSD